METCNWVHDASDDKWDTGCGEAFLFTAGGPNEYGILYCCYCGKKICVHDVDTCNCYLCENERMAYE